MKRAIQIVCVVAIVGVFGSVASAVAIDTVPVGNPDDTANAADDTGYGAVSYDYRIGKYEVTAGQYRDFLNAVDPTGANADSLYNSNMVSNSYGCRITWNSSSSTYDFSGAPSGTDVNWANRPVNFVSWYDAAMYANYLTSGNVNNGAYDTRAGVGWGDSNASNYTGITAHDSAEMDALVSTYGSVYVIPTEDEWYKAAYYRGSGSSYYDYPTSSDTAPDYVNNDGNLSNDTGTSFADGVTDPGNYATHDGDGGTDGIGSPYYRTEVGEWESSNSPYGTFDQGGNVWEWNEAILYGSVRGLRGASFDFLDVHFLSASHRYSGSSPVNEGGGVGFRVAQVPEPATMAILMLGGIGILRRRRKQ